MNIFIHCRKCGKQNCFYDVPVTRTGLAVFRGSEHREKCKGCHMPMDTMAAYCGERKGEEIERREDPK